MGNIDWHFRDIQDTRRIVQAVQMIHGAEDDGLVPLTIGLHALKNRLPIVQRRIRRADRNILIRNDAGIVPPILLVIIHFEHIVRKMRAKTDLRYIRLFLQSRRFFKFDVCHSYIPL